jgi:hypothetical protein
LFSSLFPFVWCNELILPLHSVCPA